MIHPHSRVRIVVVQSGSRWRLAGVSLVSRWCPHVDARALVMLALSRLLSHPPCDIPQP